MHQKASLTLTLVGTELAATDASNHTVFIPCNENGLRLLKSLLTVKSSNGEATLGTAARPTQAMVDAFLRSRELEKEAQAIRDIETLKGEF